MLSVGTKVYEVLQGLHAPGVRKAVDKLASVTEDERQQLTELRLEERRLKADDPAAKAKELRRCATRFEEARARLSTLETALNTSAIGGLKAAHQALASARAAADLASGRAFADAPLTGVGSETWQELWRAARKFAEQGTTPSRPFPVGPSNDARCVLCQQLLVDDAMVRMERFEEFVRGETRAQVDHAISELKKHVRRLELLTPDRIADQVLLDEIAALDSELVAILTECSQDLTAQRDRALAAASDGGPGIDWDAFVHSQTVARTRLEQLSRNLVEEAKRYEAKVDAGALKKVEDAIRDLDARIALEGLRERVYEEIARQERKALLKKALSTASTAAITRRNTEILKQAVTEPLRDAFARNIRALSLTHLPVAVAPSGGQKGRAYHAVELSNVAAAKVPTDEVLSEGEHRCVALAAFLAEVSLQDSASTLVFDDPVSSMDHGRREYVAREIVEIAKRRPVLVFTHDFVFLLMLQRLAGDDKLPVTPRYFRRDGTRAGLVVEDWPWDGQSVKNRLGALKQASQGFPKMATTDRPRYDIEVRLFYDRLRTTWERAVEEVLFNGAIRRFGKEVQTQRLKNLHRLTEQHIRDLEAGMKRTSDWIGGHDHAPDLALPIPEPHEVAADLDALDRWVKDVGKSVQT